MREGSDNPNRLIVEGHDDLHSVVGLMQHHVHWPDQVANSPVYITVGNGAESILRPKYLPAELKAFHLRALGLVLDADDASPQARYERVRDNCREFFSSFPGQLANQGVIVENGSGLRFGVWIMPDNTSSGGLETFLRALVPVEALPLWDHASDSVTQARSKGAKYRDPHVVKAHLYTWLAWHDPPGQQPGLALTKRALNPASPSAEAFVQWFCSLYRIPRVASV